MNQDVERYLKQATRGLWGRKRKEILKELETHIQGRIQNHLIAGSSEQEAIALTLQELGQPQQVNIGMVKLHSMPLVASFGTAMALLLTLLVNSLSNTEAQTLAVSSTFPAEVCATPATEQEPIPCDIGALWIGTEDLKKALEPQGVKFSEEYNLTVLEFLNKKRFPLTNSNNTFSIEVNGKTIGPEPGYISWDDLIEGFTARQDTTLLLEGWDSITLKVDNVVLRLISDEQGIGRSTFYNPHLWHIFGKAFGLKLLEANKTVAVLAEPDGPFGVDRKLETRSMQLDLSTTEGTVYGLAMLQPANDVFVGDTTEPVTFSLYLDTAPAEVDGSVVFHVPQNHFIFSTNPTDSGMAVLIRLSGEFSAGQFYEVIPPEQIQIQIAE
jgi:hypothetical protein